MRKIKEYWSPLLVWQKALVVVSTLLVLHAIFGFLILPSIIRYAITSQLPPILHRNVTLQKVYCNPFTYEISIDGFAIRERDNSRDFIAFDKFYANLQPISAVRMALVLTNVRLDSPRIFLRLNKDGSLNTDDLADSGNNTAPEAKKDPFIPPIIVEPFLIQNGSIILEDQKRAVTHTVDQIRFDIPKFSSRKKDWTTYMRPSLSFRVNGAPFDLEGRTMPFDNSLRTEFALHLIDLGLPSYWAYVPASKDLQLTNGTLTLETKLSFEQYENKLPKFSIQGTLRGNAIILKEHDNTVFSAKQAEIVMDDISVLNLHVGLKHVHLENPYIHVIRRQNGAINWAQYFTQPSDNATQDHTRNATVISANAEASNATAANASNANATATAANSTAPEKAHLLLKIPEISITDGKVTFDDLTLSQKFTKTLTKLNVQIEDLSTAANATAKASLTTTSQNEEQINANATFSIAPTAATAATALLNVRNLDVPSYKAYFQKALPLDLTQAKVDASIAFGMHEALPRLENSSIQIRDLQLSQTGKPGKIGAQRIALDKITMDLSGQKIHTGKLTIEGASLVTGQDSSGRADILTAFEGSNATSSQSSASSQPVTNNATTGKNWEVLSDGITVSNASLSIAGDKGKEPVKINSFDVGTIKLDTAQHSVTIGDIGLSFGLDLTRTKDGQIDLAELFAPAPAKQPAKPAPAPARTAPEWKAGISAFAITNSQISLTDDSVNKPATVKIDQISAAVKAISTDLKKTLPLTFACRVGNSGTINAKSDLTPEPFGSKGNVKIAGIPLDIINPYIGELANIALTSGKLNADLNWTVDDKMKGKVSGNLDAESLRMTETQNKSEVAGFASFRIQNLVLQLEPLSVAIGSILLNEPRAAFSIDSKGKTTLDRIIAKQSSAKEAKNEPKQKQTKTNDKNSGLQKLSVGKFPLTKEKFTFTDQSLTPRYQTNITPVDLTVTDISLDPDQRSELDLKALIDGSAPLTVSGWISPLKEPLEANSNASLHNLDLVGLSPYSSKFIAYPVSRGQLNWDMTLNTQNNSLSMKNAINAQKLELGDKVNSPDAPNVPIKLGLSLLRDTSGNIAINLPIHGDMNDPQFNVGGIVIQAFLGLIVKAVASPFTILGALIPDGGGQDMGKLEFAPGIATPGPEMMKTLESMAKVMAERPALNISLRGNADPKTDTTGLMDVSLTRKLQAIKYDDLSRREKEKTKLEELTITPEEYPDLLWQAYKNEPMEKEKNAIGMTKEVPVDVQETKLKEAAKIGEEDLVRLAQERAENLKNTLVQKLQVDAGRIFLTNAGPQALSGSREVSIEVRQ